MVIEGEGGVLRCTDDGQRVAIEHLREFDEEAEDGSPVDIVYFNGLSVVNNVPF